MSPVVALIAGALALGLSAASSQAAPIPAASVFQDAPEVLAPEPIEDDLLQSAAGVVRVDWVADDGAKMFGLAGGDPAMNGLFYFIAFYGSQGDGWTVFRLGDVLDYTILSSSRGRVELDLRESVLDEASGEIGERRRKAVVTWTVEPDDAPPSRLTIAPLR